MKQTHELDQNLWQKISALDCECIKFKLVTEYGWSLESADRTELDYKRFLYLAALHGKDRGNVPTKSIDEFWHQHILDTRKYFEDCETVFGHYLHHFPYFGVRGEEDKALLEATFRTTCKKWFDVFGKRLA